MSSSRDQRRRNLFGHPLAAVGDTILSMCFVAPLVVGYWRGTWDLIDVYLYPNDTALSCWISLAFGCSALCLATWLQNGLQTIIVQQSGCIFFVLSRLYTVTYCLGSFLFFFFFLIINLIVKIVKISIFNAVVEQQYLKKRRCDVIVEPTDIRVGSHWPKWPVAIKTFF